MFWSWNYFFPFHKRSFRINKAKLSKNTIKDLSTNGNHKNRELEAELKFIGFNLMAWVRLVDCTPHIKPIDTPLFNEPLLCIY